MRLMSIRGLFAWRGGSRALPGSMALWGVQALACVAVAWLAAQALWGLATPASAPLAAKALPTLAEQAHRVGARHFFDVQEAPEPSSKSARNGPPPTTLDPRWKLLGTYVDPAGHSRALLMLDGTTDVLVAQVGDRLPSGHVLAEVRPESVVMGKDAQRAELTLRAAAGTPTAAPDAQPLPPGARVPPPVSAAPITKDSR